MFLKKLFFELIIIKMHVSIDFTSSIIVSLVSRRGDEERYIKLKEKSNKQNVNLVSG